MGQRCRFWAAQQEKRGPFLWAGAAPPQGSSLQVEPDWISPPDSHVLRPALHLQPQQSHASHPCLLSSRKHTPLPPTSRLPSYLACLEFSSPLSLPDDLLDPSSDRAQPPHLQGSPPGGSSSLALVPWLSAHQTTPPFLPILISRSEHTHLFESGLISVSRAPLRVGITSFFSSLLCISRT